MYSVSTKGGSVTIVDVDLEIIDYGSGILRGHVMTYDFCRTLVDKGICKRLENWHPRMFGTVWYNQINGDPRQNIGEMDFMLTACDNPILILKSNGQVLLEVIKRKVHVYL